MLAVMFKATKSGTEQYDGYMSIQVPVNMRKFYPSDTLRNFSMYCAIRIPLNKDYEFSELLTEIDEQLKVKADKQSMSEMLTSTENLINSIKLIPLIIKNPVSKIMYGVLGDKAFSNTLSNLGVVNMPACCLEHIESMDFVLGTSVINRVSSAMITINNTTTFSITKKTLDPSYEETMYKILVNEGITVDVEGSDIYEN